MLSANLHQLLVAAQAAVIVWLVLVGLAVCVLAQWLHDPAKLPVEGQYVNCIFAAAVSAAMLALMVLAYVFPEIIGLQLDVRARDLTNAGMLCLMFVLSLTASLYGAVVTGRKKRALDVRLGLRRPRQPRSPKIHSISR